MHSHLILLRYSRLLPPEASLSDARPISQMCCVHLYGLHVYCALVDLDFSGSPGVSLTPGLASSTPSVQQACVCAYSHHPPRYWHDEHRRPPKHPRLQAAVCHPPRHWPDEPRRPPSLQLLPRHCSLKNCPKSTPAHGSVAAAVSHKHHSISRVGAGLLQVVCASTRTSVARGHFH